MKDKFLRIILSIIAAGIWMIGLQNSKVFDNRQDVYVRGGYINAGVSGSVSVDNTVDINIQEINGKNNVFYDNGYDKNYCRIPVYTGR